MSTQTARQCRKHIHQAKVVLLVKIVSMDKDLSLTRLLHVLLRTKKPRQARPLPVRNGPAKKFQRTEPQRRSPATGAYALAHDIGSHPPSRNVLDHYV